MKKRVYYGVFVKKAKKNLELINEQAKKFCQHEMTPQVQFEMNRVLELSTLSKDESKALKPKDTFRILFDRLWKIEDCVGEVRLLTGDIIKSTNNLPKEQKQRFYYFLGITPIQKEDQGISEECSTLLFVMQYLSTGLVEKGLNMDMENDNYD